MQFSIFQEAEFAGNLVINTDFLKFEGSYKDSGYRKQTEIETEFIMFGQEYSFTFKILKASLYLLTQLPNLGLNVVDLSWNHDDYKILYEYNGKTFFKFLVKRTQKSLWTGEFYSEAVTIWENFQVLVLQYSYDLDTVLKKHMDIEFKFNNYSIGSKLHFNATHDTCDGVLILSSSFKNYDNIVIRGYYNIKANPEVRISVQRNKELKVVNMTIFFDNIIPSIKIKTPFKRYEEINVRGNLTENSLSTVVCISVTINKEKLFNIDTNISRSADKRKFMIRSKYTSENLGYNSEVSVEYDSSAHITLKLFAKTEKEEYMLKGLFSSQEAFFNIDFTSPIETVSLTGQFGTTHVKTSISFTKGREKRDLSFDYTLNEDSVSINIKIPNKLLRKIRFTAHQTESKKLDFLFQTSGLENDFIWGLQFDFIEYIYYGRILSNISIPHLNIDYSGEFSYKIDHKDIYKYFESKILIKKQGNFYISSEIRRIPGETKITLNTPVENWEEVRLCLTSDWISNIDLSVQSQHLYKINLTRRDQDVFIQVNTPFSGLENVKASYQYVSSERHVHIYNNEDLITSIYLYTMVSEQKNNGKVVIKWETTKTFIYLTIEIRETKAILSIETSFAQLKQLHLNAEQHLSGSTEKTAIIILYNGFHMTYKSESSWFNDLIESNTTFDTNIPFFGFRHSETAAKIVYSKNLESPSTLDYKVTTDEKTTLDLHSSVSVNLKDREIEIIYQGDLPHNQGKIDALLHIKSDFSTKLEMIGKINEITFKLTGIQSGMNAHFLFKSNISGYEYLKGSVAWKISKNTNKIYGVETKFMYHDNKTLVMSVEFDTFPFTQFQGTLVVPGFFNESVLISVLSKEYAYLKIFSIYEGFNTIEVNVTLDLEEKVIDISIDNKSADRQWKFILKASKHRISPIQLFLDICVFTPFTEKFTMRIHLDLANAKKEIEFHLNFGIIQASFKLNIIMSSNFSEIFSQAFCPVFDLNTFEIKGMWKPYNIARLIINVNGQVFNLLLKNKFTDQDFNVGMILSLPFHFYENIVVEGYGRCTSDSAINVSFNMSISNKNFTLQYTQEKLNFHLKILLPWTEPKEFVIQSEILQFKKYYFYVVFNDMFMNLKHEFDRGNSSLTLNYDSSLSHLKELSIWIHYEKHSNCNMKMNYFGNNINAAYASSFAISDNGLAFDNYININKTLTKANMNFVKYGNRSVLIVLFESGSTHKVSLYQELKEDKKMDFNFNLNSTSLIVQTHLGLTKSKGERNIRIFAEFNNNTFNINAGHRNGHIYFECSSPIKNFEVIKMNFNHQNGNLKVTSVVGPNLVEANFIRKITIYNFDVKVNGSICFLKFEGKIDIAGKALQTSMAYNNKRLSMKANYNGHKVAISLKTTFKNFESIVFNGKWAEIPNGFNVKASADVNKIYHEFEAKFTRDVNETIGFWRATNRKNEIKFNLAVARSPESMNIYINLALPENKEFEFNTSYVLKNEQFGAFFELKTPYDTDGPKLGFEFCLKYLKTRSIFFEFAMKSNEKLCDLGMNLRFGNVSNAFLNLTLHVPSLFTGIILQVELIGNSSALEASFNLQHHNIMKFGKVVLQRKESKLQATLNLIWPEFCKAITINLEYSTGKILIEVNNSFFQIEFCSAKYLISLQLNIDIALLHYLSLNNVMNNVEISFYIKYYHLKEFQIEAAFAQLGKMTLTLINKPAHSAGAIMVKIPKFNLNKIIKIDLKAGAPGSMDIYIADGETTIDMSSETPGNNDTRIRKVRAALYSPQFGNIFFNTEKAHQAGVFLLSYKNQIHKFSYDVKNITEYEITVQIESPILENGYATCKFSSDAASSYKLRFSLNNDHFVSGYLNLHDSVHIFKLDIETRKLPHRMSLGGTITNRKDEKALELHYFFQKNNSVTVRYQKETDSFSFLIAANSIIIPQEVIECNFNVLKNSTQYDMSIKMLFGNCSFHLSSAGDVKSPIKFSSKAIFLFPQYEISEINLYLNIDSSEEKCVNLHMFTSHETLSLFTAGIRCQKFADYSIVTVTVTIPIKGYEFYQIKIETKNLPFNNSDSGIIFISITLSTPFGETLGDLDIRFGKKIFVSLKIHFPMEKYFSITLFSEGLQNFHCVVKSKMSTFYYVYTEFRLQNDFLNREIFFDIKMDVCSKIIKFEFAALFFNGVELKSTIETPFDGFKKYSASLGFVNSLEKKLFKAYYTSPSGARGIELEYEFQTLANFVLLIKIDFPEESWTDITLDVACKILEHVINVRFGGRINDEEVQFTYLRTLKQLELTSRVKTFYIQFSLLHNILGNNQSKQTMFAELKSYFHNSKYCLDTESGDNGLAGVLIIFVNDKEVLKIRKNTEINEVSIEAKDIVYSFRVSALLINNLNVTGIHLPQSTGSLGFEITIFFDDHSIEKSITVKAIGSKTTSGFEYNMRVKFMNESIVSTKIIFQKLDGKYQQLIELYKDMEKMWGYELFSLDSTEKNMFMHSYDRITLTAPLYSIEYDMRHTRQLNKTSYSASIKLDCKGRKSRGIGYILTSNKESIKEEHSLVIRRLSGIRFIDYIVLAGHIESTRNEVILSVEFGSNNLSERSSLQVSKYMYVRNHP
jgi:hypothetical protein